jgi:hypothetical protein
MFIYERVIFLTAILAVVADLNDWFGWAGI